jgi:hypothetical protein
MKDLIFSLPELHCYLALVVALFATALWTRGTGPTGGELCIADAEQAARCNLDPASLWRSVVQCQDDQPFRDLEAALSARYAAKLEQAFRSIVFFPRAGARPTDRAGG